MEDNEHRVKNNHFVLPTNATRCIHLGKNKR